MQTQFLTLPQGKIAYDDQGSGPLVLCVPGYGDVRAEYRFLTPQLIAAGYRVVTMDLRGHGESSVNWPDHSLAAIGSDITALIRHLNAGPAHLMGCSYGAGAIVNAAITAPDLVKSLTLISPFLRAKPLPIYSRLMYSALFRSFWGVALWKSYFQTLYPSQKPADFSTYLSALLRNLGEKGRLQALRTMVTGTADDSGAALAKATCPVFVVMGSRDRDFKSPEAEITWAAETFHARTQLITGAGHYPHAEFPAETGTAIVNFVQHLAQEQETHGSENRAS